MPRPDAGFGSGRPFNGPRGAGLAHAPPSLAERCWASPLWWQLCNRLVRRVAAQGSSRLPTIRWPCKCFSAANFQRRSWPTVLPELAAGEALARHRSHARWRQSGASIGARRAMQSLHGRRLEAPAAPVGCLDPLARGEPPNWMSRSGAPAKAERYPPFRRTCRRGFSPVPTARRVLSGSPAGSPWDRRLFKTALRVADDPRGNPACVARLLDYGSPVAAGPIAARRFSRRIRVRTGRLAVLRTKLVKSAPRLAVNYGGTDSHRAEPRTTVSGRASSEVEVERRWPRAAAAQPLGAGLLGVGPRRRLPGTGAEAVG